MNPDFQLLYSKIRKTFPQAPAQFEEIVQAVYSAVLEDGNVAIDCGAHVGKHTLPMARCVMPSGSVYAFEPIEEKLSTLIESAKKESLDKVIHAFHAAVSDKNGTTMFNYVRLDPGKSSMHLRRDLLEDEKKMESTVVTEVNLVTLDEIFKESHCEFMKIDVEGAELAAMKGAKTIINSLKPVIHFEMGEPSLEVFGVSSSEIHEFLDNSGYVIYDILGSPLEDESNYMRSASAPLAYDYFALPREFKNQNLIRECSSKIFGEDDLKRIF